MEPGPSDEQEATPLAVLAMHSPLSVCTPSSEAGIGPGEEATQEGGEGAKGKGRRPHAKTQRDALIRATTRHCLYVMWPTQGLVAMGMFNPYRREVAPQVFVVPFSFSFTPICAGV